MNLSVRDSKKVASGLSPARMLFVAVLAFWPFYALALGSSTGQDAVPYIVAGRFATSEPGSIYSGGGIGGLTPDFRSSSCSFYDSIGQCDAVAAAFVSPPTAIPLAFVLSKFDDEATLVLRELGAVCLVAGMVLLWRRATAASPAAELPLVATAVLLTPLMALNVDLGQTTPLLFLAALLPLTGFAGRRRALVGGTILGLAAALKVFPLVYLAVLLMVRRGRPVLVATAVIAGLAAISVLLSGASMWHAFVETSRGVAREAPYNPHNGSIDSVLEDVGVRHGATLLALAFRATVAGVVLVVWKRRSSFAVRWAVVTAAVLLVFPQVWSHYFFAAFGAVAVAALAGRVATRLVWWLPVAAAVTAPMAYVSGEQAAQPVLLFATFLILFAMTVGLALRPLEPDDPLRPASTVMLGT